MSRRVRLIALDVDGTLLLPDKTISPRVASAVEAASQHAVVVLASARPPRSLRAIHQALSLETPQVNYNGAFVWDRINGRPLFHSPLSPALVAELIATARTHLPDVLVSVEHQDRWLTDRIDARFMTETARLFPPDVIAPLESFADLGATKLMIQAQTHEITRLRESLEIRFSDRVTFIRTDDDLLQMMDRNTSKWRTLVWLAEALGVPAEQVMAVGDNENDVEMIRNAGTGVAMGNATLDAIAAAHWIAPSNVDDGVAAAIERFVLSPAGVSLGD
jgi:Cof subfamily protein (haloacid dehalogenase superfamily)